MVFRGNDSLAARLHGSSEPGSGVMWIVVALEHRQADRPTHAHIGVLGSLDFRGFEP